jgi:hypothetical protein
MDLIRVGLTNDKRALLLTRTGYGPMNNSNTVASKGPLLLCRVSAAVKSCLQGIHIAAWLIGLVVGAAAAEDRAAMIGAICRQYAEAAAGMPADLMFRQCMSERHCWVSPGSRNYQCEAPGPLTWHGGGY